MPFPYTFSSTGSYFVQLTANCSNGIGLYTTGLIPVNVTAIVKPLFTNDQPDCYKFSACFQNNSGCVTTNTTWLWTINGNMASTAMSPCLTFPGPGIYNVCLTQNNNPVGSNNPALINVICKSIIVNAPPTVNITCSIPDLCSLTSGTQATFNAITSVSGSYVYNWSFTDAATGTPLNPILVGGTSSNPVYNLVGFTHDINVCVSIFTKGNPCMGSACLTLYACCLPPAGTTNLVMYSNSVIGTNLTLTNKNIYINNTLTINNSAQVFFDKCHVVMGPNAQIIVDKANFQIFKTWIHSCNSMWQSIYGLAGSKISVEASFIEDAKRAIVDSTGSKITLVNNWFNKNRISVNYKFNNTVTNNTLYQTGNVFTCRVVPQPALLGNPLPPVLAPTTNLAYLNPLPLTTLLAPYAGIRSVDGILIEGANVQAFNINNPVEIGQAVSGNNGGMDQISRNVFDNQDNGLYNKQSNTEIVNAWFQNNTNGIYNAGTFLYINNNNLKVGGNKNKTCIFYNNDVGLASIYTANITASRNIFNKNTFGANIKYLASPLTPLKTVTLDENTFNDNTVAGVYAHDNYTGNINLTNNHLNNNTTTGYNYGIVFNENSTNVMPTNYPLYTIYNNEIFDIGTGNSKNAILGFNTYNPQITDNYIKVKPDPTGSATNTQAFINIIGCKKAFVSNNQLTGVGGAINAANTWRRGIEVTMSDESFVSCNNITQIPASVKLNGACPSSSIYKNTFVSFYTGFWIDGANAQMGPQYNPYTIPAGTEPSDNRWIAGSVGSSALYSSNSALIGTQLVDKFYFRNTASSFYYNSQSPAILGPSNQLLAAPILVSVLNAGPANPNCLYHPTPAFKLANQTAVNAAGLPAVAHLFARRALYSNLTAGAVNTSSNVVLSTFKTVEMPVSVGQFYQVDTLLALGRQANNMAQVAQALSLSQAVLVSCAVEQNQQTYNVLYASYITNQTLDSVELSQLRTLALLCPYTDGHAVLQARGLLFNFDRTTNYTNSCEASMVVDNNNHRMSGSMEQEPESADIAMYPNPAENSIVITDVYSKAKVEVYSIMGQLILIKDIESDKETIDLSALNNGTYLVKITSDAKTLKTDRLIIIK